MTPLAIIIEVFVALVIALIAWQFKNMQVDTEENKKDRIQNKAYRSHMTEKMDNIESKVEVILVQMNDDKIEHAKINLRLEDHESRLSKVESQIERRKN